MSYHFSKNVNMSFNETINKVTEELKKEGFGVLTTIDVKETLKKKLDVDFKRYTILGACSPPNAYKALQAEEDIGLMLPCNVIVYESEGGTTVSLIKPNAAMGMIDNPQLKEVAAVVENKMEKVFNRLEI